MTESDIREFASELRKNPQLDLHGRFPDNSFSVVDQFLYQNLNEQQPSVEVIYGIGKGKLKEAVLEFLEDHPLVEKVLDKGGACIVLLNTNKN